MILSGWLRVVICIDLIVSSPFRLVLLHFASHGLFRTSSYSHALLFVVTFVHSKLWLVSMGHLDCQYLTVSTGGVAIHIL